MSEQLETFDVSASPSAQRRYRSLLRSDFSEASLKDSLGLVRAILESAGRKLLFEWEAPPRKPAPRYAIPTAATDYLREFLQRTNDELYASVPDEVPERTNLEKYAVMAGVFLTFQSRVRVVGDAAFLRDAQSQLFFSVLHVALPKLDDQSRTSARNFLVNACWAFVQRVWADNPAHQHYLFARLYDYLGDSQNAKTSLRASLYGTAPDEHDYLTKVQAYWDHLLERNEIGEAKQVLLRIYRSSPPEHLEELEELLDETYRREAALLSNAS